MPRKKRAVEEVAAPAVEADEVTSEVVDAVGPESAGQSAGNAAGLDEIPGATAPDADDTDLLEALSDEASRALTFRLGEQLYGLPIGFVQEIQQIVELMPLPDAAPALVGLLDVRGLVVPAIDLRTLVGMPRREYTLQTPMVLCRVHGKVVCLIVDAVEDVVEIPHDCMQAPSALYALADRMVGVCRLPQGLVLMLDPERLVPDTALAAADRVGGES